MEISCGICQQVVIGLMVTLIIVMLFSQIMISRIRQRLKQVESKNRLYNLEENK
jgi:septation ring formation regulator EzrA